MATFRERPLKDGSTSYTAIITRQIDGKRYQETKTDAKRKLVAAWAKKREAEIDADIAAGRKVQKRGAKKVTLGDAIDKYIADSMTEIGKTKAQVLRTIRTEYDIADMPCDKIESPDIVAFVRELHKRPDLNSASTAGNYLSHLSSIFAIARPLWGLPLDEQAIKDAQKVCGRMGYTSKSNKRTRRPTLDEMNRLMEHFHAASAADSRVLPMHVVCAFAIFSTRRQEEICRITWADFEPSQRRVLVRDLKHPGQKEGNDVWCELPDPCCAIINAQPRKEERVFPFNSDTVSARFTRACKFLGIKDLRFHDLRHDGTSRLFEMGRTAPLAAAVTGHRSWSSLERYTHIANIGDKYEDWRWIQEVT